MTPKRFCPEHTRPSHVNQTDVGSPNATTITPAFACVDSNTIGVLFQHLPYTHDERFIIRFLQSLLKLRPRFVGQLDVV